MTATPPALVPLPARMAPVNTDVLINQVIQHMTLDQKLGQLLMVEFDTNSYSSDLDAMIRDAHVGGFIVYVWNMASIAATQNITAQAQSHADLPLEIAIDQEGGNVDRLINLYGPSPSAWDVAQTGDPAFAQSQGVLTAQRLQQLGINMNLAPVVDVSTIPNSVLYNREYATTTDEVDTYAGAFMRGLQTTGVAACLKHFPGIGSLTSDPHQSLLSISRNLSELNAVDFPAFQHLFAQGPASVMVTGVLVPEIDPALPVTVSPAAVDGVLRKQLGYQGVIITDQLRMKGISNTYDLGEAGVLSVLAGDDILEGAYTPDSAQLMLSALRAAVKSGRIPLARIEESDRRILQMKLAYHMGDAFHRFMQFAGITS